MRETISIAKNNLVKMFSEGRFIYALLINLVLMKQLADNIKSFSTYVGVKCSPWIFPFLTQQYFIQFMIIVGATILFCDAPFIDHESYFEIIRSGKLRWIVGKEIYILFVSFIYSISIFLLSVVLLMPRVSMTFEWGKVISTLSQTNAGEEFYSSYLLLDHHIIQRFNPIEACGFSVILTTIVCFISGQCDLFINLFFHKIPGAVGGITIALLPFFQRNFSNLYRMSFFSPASWMDLSLWKTKIVLSYPSTTYMATYLALCILGLSIANTIRFKYAEDLGKKNV